VETIVIGKLDAETPGRIEGVVGAEPEVAVQGPLLDLVITGQRERGAVHAVGAGPQRGFIVILVAHARLEARQRLVALGGPVGTERAAALRTGEARGRNGGRRRCQTQTSEEAKMDQKGMNSRTIFRRLRSGSRRVLRATAHRGHRPPEQLAVPGDTFRLDLLKLRMLENRGFDGIDFSRLVG